MIVGKELLNLAAYRGMQLDYFQIRFDQGIFLTVEPVTDPLSLTADSREDGLVKARGDEATDSVCQAWHDKVYGPFLATQQISGDGYWYSKGED